MGSGTLPPFLEKEINKKQAASLPPFLQPDVKKKDLGGASATGSATVGTGAVHGKSQSEEEGDSDFDLMPSGILIDNTKQMPSVTGGALKSSTARIAKKKSLGWKPDDNFISEYNKRFDESIGSPEFNIGSDLPQIKKQREAERFIQNVEKEDAVKKHVNNISGVDATLKDFEQLKRLSPKVFESVKNSLNIQQNQEDAVGDQFKDENYVWNVFNDYKQIATDLKLESARTRRQEIQASLPTSLAEVSTFTGSTYSEPKNLEEAKKIIDDIQQKKDDELLIFKNNGGGLSEKIEQMAQLKKSFATVDKTMPELTDVVSGFVFDEMSRSNPNVTPFEVGKRIFEITNPKEYALYQQAGGDKPYGQMFVNRSETPKYADAYNRMFTRLGNEAFYTFGNKASIEKADESNEILGWKYTLSLEERAKHMIAAKLWEQGIRPNKASSEQADAAANELPETYRNIWFDKNKPENNTKLPSTGVGYSVKSAYFNTVEDGAKSLLGWMLPENDRGRALEVLKRRTQSSELGENPEDVARLNALKEKEKSGAELTESEVQEKLSLEKYTGIRTRWQKFTDMAGTGLGQIAGFGTISAFTGGLGNVRTGAGVLRSLVSPSAGKYGNFAGAYLMSREENARNAVEMFPGENEGVKRFVYGEVASAIDALVEQIFPEEKFLNGVLKKDLAKLIPNLTEKNIRKELNETFTTKLAKNIFTKVAEWQKTPIQEFSEEIIAAKLKDVFGGILNPEYGHDPITFDELINVGTQAFLSSQFLGAPKGIFAQRNPHVAVNAIWDAASDKATFEDVKFTINDLLQKGELTQDEANERISLLNTARGNWESNPILSGGMGNLSLPKRQNYLTRLMDEAVLQKQADAATDENVKSTLNKQIADSKKARKAIYENETFVTSDNKEVAVKDLTPHQIIIQQAEDGRLGAYSEMVRQNPSLANDVLIDYAKQMYGVSDNGSDLDGGGRSLPSKEIENAVKKMFPAKETLVADIKGKAAVSKINQTARDAGEQLMPILQRINDADYINEVELNNAADRLYEIMDEVEKSDMSDQQKQSSLNLIEPIINKIEGYEFRTKTETGTTTETKATIVPRPVVEKTKIPALEQARGSEVEVTLPNGDKRKGTIDIKGGTYVVDIPKGTQVVLGEKAITDRDLTIPSVEEMENPVEFDSDGNVSSITFKTKSGNLVKIKNSEKALDLAIQLRAEMVKDVSPADFDIVYEEVQKPYTREVLVSDKSGANKSELTDDALDLIDKFSMEGSKPNYTEVRDGKTQLNTSIKKIATENGIEIKDGMTAKDIASALKEKQQSQPTVTTKEQKLEIKNEPIQEAPETTQPKPSEEVIGVKETVNKEGGGAIPPEPPKAAPEQLGEGVGITHAQANKIAVELGFPEYEESPETVAQWDEEAKKRIKNGEIGSVIRKLENGDMPYKVEQRMMLQYIGSLKAEINKNPTNEKLMEIKHAIELSNLIGGREVAKSLVARKGSIIADDSLAGFMLRDMVELGQDELTEGQKKAIEAEYKRIEKAQREFDEWVAKKEEEITLRQAGLSVQEMAKGKRPASKLKTLNEERQSILLDIRLKAKAARDSASFLGVAELVAIAPDVIKLAKNLVETGVTGVVELTGMIRDYLKDDLPGLEEKQIREILAGKHTEKKKPTKSDLAIKWKDLTDEVKLIEKLEDLENGEIPVNEKQKIERNQQITALRKQIKEHNLTQLTQAKTRMKSEIEKIKKQLDSGDFSKPEKSEIKFDEEGRRLQKELVDARKERDIRIEKQKYEKRSAKKKVADKIVEVMNIPRSIMASVDFSAPLNQAIVATISYPEIAKKAFAQMIKSASSSQAFDQWFYDLKEDPNYELMKELKLKISDPHSPYLIAREEAFMSGYAEQLSKGIFGKIGLDPIGGSERAYVQYLNKMRVDIFNKLITQFEEDGKSYKNSKVLYEKTARFVNNITGAGSFGKMDQIAPYLNSLFFSPRLIASRLNLLNPYYFYTLPKELKKEYGKDMLKFAGLGLTILGAFYLYSKTQDDDDPDKIFVETDPRSSDFGKIRQGNTRWNFWGGFQPYVSLLSKLTAGQVKSTTSGVVRDIDSEDMYAPKTEEMFINFFRGKLAPVFGAGWNIVSGENMVGEETTFGNQIKSLFIPLSAQSIAEGWKDYGPMALLNIGVPSAFGVGTQTYEPKKREVKDEISIRVFKNGKYEQMKVELDDKQFNDYKGRAEKYIDNVGTELEKSKDFKDLSPEEKQAIKRNLENAAVKKAQDEIIKKYKNDLEKRATQSGKSEKADKVEGVIKKRLN